MESREALAPTFYPENHCPRSQWSSAGTGSTLDNRFSGEVERERLGYGQPTPPQEDGADYSNPPRPYCQDFGAGGDHHPQGDGPWVRENSHSAVLVDGRTQPQLGIYGSAEPRARSTPSSHRDAGPYWYQLLPDTPRHEYGRWEN